MSKKNDFTKKFICNSILLIICEYLWVRTGANSTQAVFFILEIIFGMFLMFNIDMFLEWISNFHQKMKNGFILKSTSEEGIRVSLVITICVIIFIGYFVLQILIGEIIWFVASKYGHVIEFFQLIFVICIFSIEKVLIKWAGVMIKKCFYRKRR